ncbi:competence protein ComEA [Ruminiclostridium sufflavum DSM 19573]|uniref:Competence protein ComEA n=1 Tax=Ruminiclostridium sufflavum DSM 19573 TaxID=1121337 RepID=A0A318XIU4_9FIRM|nr:helix-hairpin-helix domain-containing protein [Ruminiclostridium sufflavum]PYG86944.1 competence protein ComEA [Ruminiclostridium sufflavum DSM 19573]
MEITLFGRKVFISRALFFCLIIILIIGTGFLGYFLKQVYKPLSGYEIPEVSISDTSKADIIQVEEAVAAAVTEDTEEVPEIKVYVVGCVNKPGIVTIKKGQLIDDAVKMAGGATKEADIENINMAYILDENTMLRIRAKASGSKPAEDAKPDGIQKSSEDTNKEKKLNSGVDIVTDSMEAVVEEKRADSKAEGSLININEASQAELEKLPNIGPATAKAIIAYREEKGKFDSIADIMKITGIKQKTYDKIKACICVE